MAITLPSGFVITNQQPIDSRLVLTKSEMLATVDARMPQNYICVCKDDGKLYIYNSGNTKDSQTGKFRLYLEDELNLKQDKLIAGDGITIDENNVISASVKENAYNYIKQIADYLFEVQYSTGNVDYDYANEFFKNASTEKVGYGSKVACTGVVDGTRVLRHLDWFYNDGEEFIVRRPADPENGIHASVGVSFGTPDLTKPFVESGAYSDSYKLVPFTTTDGINDAGLYAQLNILQPLEGGFDLNPGASTECCILMTIRYILDHCSNFRDVEKFFNTVHIFKTNALDCGYHILLAQGNDWEVIELTNNGHITVTEGTGTNQMPHGIMTNFRTHGLSFDGDNIDWSSVETYGMGVERFDVATTLFNENKTLENLREELKYTLLYTDPLRSWKTEYCGENGTQGSKLTVSDAKTHPEYFDRLFDICNEKYENRTRTNDSGTWQTTHSAIYDLENKKFSLAIQERFDKFYEFSLSGDLDVDLSGYAKLVDLEIGKEIVVQRTVGGIAEGTVYTASTKMAKIIEDLLGNSSPLPGEGNIYYGVRDVIPSNVSGMSSVEVNATELKRNGYTWKYIDAENQYICLAIDKALNLNCYEISQSGFALSFKVIDLGEQMLYVLDDKVTDTGIRLLYKFDESSPGPRYSKLYRSVNSDIPTTVEGMESISADSNELKENGYTWRNISADNKYICLAIDRSLNVSCYEINQNGFGLGFKVIDLGDQILYVLDDKVTDTGIRLLYKFE